MSKLSITRGSDGHLVFSMTDLTGTKEEQEEEFVDFFLDVQHMIDSIANDTDDIEVKKYYKNDNEASKN